MTGNILGIKTVKYIQLFIITFCSILFSTNVHPVQIESIKVVSEEYKDETNHDGTGLYWHIIDEVFKELNVEIEKIVVPYVRAVKMVEVGLADFWVASYINEESFAIYPKYHFDVDLVAALYLKDRIKWVDINSNLTDARVGWVRGYGYEDYLKVKMDYYEVNNGFDGVRMLGANRFDYYIDADTEIEKQLQAIGKDQADYGMEIVHVLPLYIAFKDNEKGELLREIWDRNFKVMLDSGRVEELYKLYNAKWKHKYMLVNSP